MTRMDHDVTVPNEDGSACRVRAAAEHAYEEHLQRIWVQHLPATRCQVERVVDALLDIERGICPCDIRTAARADAHQIIGVAATFGRAYLARIARAAERLLRAPELSSEELAELTDVADRLNRAALTLVGPPGQGGHTPNG